MTARPRCRCRPRFCWFDFKDEDENEDEDDSNASPTLIEPNDNPTSFFILLFSFLTVYSSRVQEASKSLNPVVQT